MRKLLAALAAALLLAACGGSTTKVGSALPDCQGVSYTMGCVGKQSTIPSLTVTPSQFGVDFEGAPSPYTLKNDGVKFAVSYLSGVWGKDWTRGQLEEYHAAGVRTAFVFERSADDAVGGCSAGLNDARAALNEANELGVPSTVGIPLAIDADVSGASVYNYFACAHEVLGSRLGAYGSYWLIAYLNAHGLTRCANDYQTVAWSDGYQGCAGIYQSSINNGLPGEPPPSLDFDHAYTNTANLWPALTPPIICFGKHAQGNATCQKVHAQVRAWTAAVTESQQVYSARGCPALVVSRNALQARWEWFHTQLVKRPRVKTKKREGALKATGRALNSVRGQISGRKCLVFSDRVSYYDGKIQALEKEYSS